MCLSFIYRKEEKLHSSLFLSRNVNKKPLTMRRAIGLGILRHSRPSTYATIPDNTNFPMPHFQMNFTFGLSSVACAGSTALSLSPSKSLFHLVRTMNLLACFLSKRIAKLTNKCSHNVSKVGPSLGSCVISSSPISISYHYGHEILKASKEKKKDQ